MEHYRGSCAGVVRGFRTLCGKLYYRGNHQPAGDPYRGAITRYPGVVAAITKLKEESFPILSYDASLGGNYPMICVVRFNPTNGTCFASFGIHPDFGGALERTVIELL